MNWRQWTIFVLLIVYMVVAGGLTIYHAYNFSDYGHVKGDETFNYIKCLLWTSILFQGLIWVITKTLDWKTAVVATIGNTIISFILGFIIIMASGLSGLPRHLIFAYGACFMTIFALVTIIQTRKLKTN